MQSEHPEPVVLWSVSARPIRRRDFAARSKERLVVACLSPSSCGVLTANLVGSSLPFAPKWRFAGYFDCRCFHAANRSASVIFNVWLGACRIDRQQPLHEGLQCRIDKECIVIDELLPQQRSWYHATRLVNGRTILQLGRRGEEGWTNRKVAGV